MQLSTRNSRPTGSDASSNLPLQGRGLGFPQGIPRSCLIPAKLPAADCSLEYLHVWRCIPCWCRAGGWALPEGASFSPDIVQLLRGLLEPDPGCRWTAAAALKSPWMLPRVRRGVGPSGEANLGQLLQLLSERRSYAAGQVRL